MTVFALSNAVLLGSMRARDTMNYASTLKITVEAVILPTPIRLNRLDLGVQKTLNMSLERIENLLNVRLMFEKIYPAKTRVIIHKANIVFVSPRRNTSRTPDIGVNKLKRLSRNT
jgi:hypothetical protein